jgi:hypothetical protein
LSSPTSLLSDLVQMARTKQTVKKSTSNGDAEPENKKKKARSKSFFLYS